MPLSTTVSAYDDQRDLDDPVDAGADDADGAAVSFPRQSARTVGFTLGAPRSFTVAPDGRRIVFLRAPSATDRATELWVRDLGPDLESGDERRVVDPAALLAGDIETYSPEERARRERMREQSAGVVSYATDAAVRVAAFALSSRLWVADLDTGAVTELPAHEPVVDPRVDPTGRSVAYASGRELRLIGVDGSDDRVLAGPDTGDADTVVWGLAEFIAAEELDRTRGFWWAPDGSALLVERYDEAPVPVWHLADPANPQTPSRPVRYPAAGTHNAEVSLWLVGLDGGRHEIRWDRERFCYLVDVSWSSYGPPLLHVLTRDQRTAQVLRVDLATGQTAQLHEESDPAWVEQVGGVPRWLPDGRLVTTVDRRHTRRLAVDGSPVTPEGFQIRAVLDVDPTGVLVSASYEPTELHVAHVDTDGVVTLLTSEPGVHSARAGGGTVVVASQSLDHPGVRVTVLRDGEPVAELRSRQARPPFAPRVTLLKVGMRDLRAAVLFPRDHVPGSRRLPVLLDPYGGPHAQRVLASRRLFLTPQWLADQGFCVVVADGRGTAGRGPAWEREVVYDFTGTVDDQVEALREVARLHPDDVDLGRVGIRGWSFGGYLAAMAVLHRPDVFHAAVAGAPVTDWRLYDTCYTERYLGHPDEKSEVYERNSLVADADRLERPLLLVHGLADDNVVAAHTLRLSSALTAAGRPHQVLPLSGVTHMTPQEVVAENLLLLQVRFLHDALAADRPTGGTGT